MVRRVVKMHIHRLIASLFVSVSKMIWLEVLKLLVSITNKKITHALYYVSKLINSIGPQNRPKAWIIATTTFINIVRRICLAKRRRISVPSVYHYARISRVPNVLPQYSTSSCKNDILAQAFVWPL